MKDQIAPMWFSKDLEKDPDEIRDALISLIDALRENLKDIVEEEGYMDDI